MLAASLALNLFFIGLMAGRHMSLRPHFGRDDESGTRAFLRHSGLREAGPEVKAILRQRHAEIRQRMRAVGQARDQVRQALEAEPYDRAAAEQALRRTRELTTQMQADMHQALIEVADKLDRDQRKRMADSLWGHHHMHR